MKIAVQKNHGYYLIFEAENVKVTEDIEMREYPKDENGKTIININPKRDIKTDALDQMARVLEDMIYYRYALYDSSSLIKQLFEKLPPQIAESLSKTLYENNKY